MEPRTIEGLLRHTIRFPGEYKVLSGWNFFLSSHAFTRANFYLKISKKIFPGDKDDFFLPPDMGDFVHPHSEGDFFP